MTDAEAIVRDVFGSDKWKLEVGKRVKGPNGRLCKVVDGAYFRDGRLSNFWSWRYVGKNGKLGPLQHGYGWC